MTATTHAIEKVSDENPCVDGEEWCPGPDADELPCWSCYLVRQGVTEAI